MDSFALRPRKPTEIVDAAIEVYRRHPLHFMLLTALVHVPWVILQLVVLGNAAPMEQIVSEMLIGVGTLITYYLISGVVVQLASDLYLGRDSDAFDALLTVGWRVIPTFGASVLLGIAVAVSALFLLLPAVYVSAAFFAVIPVVVLERRGVAEAFSRSSHLSYGLKGRILSVLGLVVLIRVALSVGGAILIQVIPNFAAQRLLTAVIAIVVYPFSGIASTLLYYDARIRREGFDIEVMAGPPSGSGAAAA